MSEATGDRPRVRTCFWFEGRGREAAEFYVSLLSNSVVETDPPADPASSDLVVEFTLDGVPFTILNGGPVFAPTHAASIVVHTEDQAETDRLWEALVADGGEPGRCGWLTDRFGLSWQIVPEILSLLMRSADRDVVARVTEAMMAMSKLSIAGLLAAQDGG